MRYFHFLHLNQCWRYTDEACCNARDSQVQNVEIFGCSVGLLAYNINIVPGHVTHQVHIYLFILYVSIFQSESLISWTHQQWCRWEQGWSGDPGDMWLRTIGSKSPSKSGKFRWKEIISFCRQQHSHCAGKCIIIMSFVFKCQTPFYYLHSSWQ